MARVVDYAEVLTVAAGLGLRCVYYNTGSFGYADGSTGHVVCWLGPDDATIRPEFAAAAVRVPPPYPANLAARFAAAWPAVAAGAAWVVPKSHWAFELDHGNGPWLVPALAAAGVDAGVLRGRTDGSAVAFDAGDPACPRLIETLLANLSASDFAVLFPTHRHLVTVHHHRQLWWQTPDAAAAEGLRRVDAHFVRG